MRPWRVRRVVVPQPIAATFAYSTANDTVSFALTTDVAGSRTPLQWAKAVFEDAPAVVRWCISFGWRYVLGLKLGPRPSDDHVLGWAVARSDLAANSTALLAESRFLQAWNIVMVHETTVTWVTLVHYSHWAARPLWVMAKPIHRLIIRSLLARAARAAVTESPSTSAA